MGCDALQGRTIYSSAIATNAKGHNRGVKIGVVKIGSVRWMPFLIKKWPRKLRLPFCYSERLITPGDNKVLSYANYKGAPPTSGRRPGEERKPGGPDPRLVHPSHRPSIRGWCITKGLRASATGGLRFQRRSSAAANKN